MGFYSRSLVSIKYDITHVASVCRTQQLEAITLLLSTKCYSEHSIKIVYICCRCNGAYHKRVKWKLFDRREVAQMLVRPQIRKRFAE